MTSKGENPKHKQKKTSKAKSAPKTCNETSKLRSTPSPPMECTVQEYNNLLSIASSLSPDEAKTEFVECARYGDLDAVRALIEIWSSPPSSSPSVSKIHNFVNTAVDSNGTTALHKAGSNGHLSTVQLLLHNGARHLMNTSKNTPLHWAARNGHEGVVEMILKHDFRLHGCNDNGLGLDIDVLQKNEFGRSILTEGFASENTKLVGLLLEHDSASEDKLLDGGTENDENSNEKEVEEFNEKVSNQENETMKQSIAKANKSKKVSIIHEFDFLRDNGDNDKGKIEATSTDINYGDNTERSVNTMKGEEEETNKTLLIRELPITNADTPFGETAIDDTTGLGIWSASLVMSRWMASKSIFGRFDNKTVLELGAGCGVPALTVALYSRAKSIYVSDLNPDTIENIRYNIEINAKSSNSGSSEDWLNRVSAQSIDWDNEETWPQEKMDFIIGSDLIYQKSIVPLLQKVVNGLLKPEGRFLYTCPSDGRDGLVEFIDTMKKKGFRCISEEVAPDLYKTNPLSSGDEEDAFLHFYELPVTEYKLYEFRMS
mmetsp:Transcript_10672/g.16094  ORF Transcript_10672/g.16094 Transcript_10672/m.16094 type:complete len:544 (-) Transcript_10672:2668-4299(-)|eukprot:CAMPEP_0203673260 /NCGR_PEP_ID=MMETSP0090-20130426/11683_1 /ASSEMBLY_ACC=CAM_ASM_001088 /TAXON_ID=426623 /ORGANISM="Chaetoceros affinis, Strain CCMP159" /LENGTH=543 /DNA_ID=CAMNT_0050538871 /DNA_START=60 /DNA_END=1691 /DNA_ORIENTATION=+